MSALNIFCRNSIFLRSKFVQRTILNGSFIPRRSKTDDSYKSSDLTSSTILVQDGLTVQELPVIVYKVKNVLYPHIEKSDVSENSTKYTEKESSVHLMINKEFAKCSTLDDVYLLLSKCSTITPNIALGALECVYNICDSLNNNGEILLDTVLLDKLCNIISCSDDIYAIMRALNVVVSKNKNYLDILSDEILKRIADNKLSVLQACDVIAFFGNNIEVEKYSLNIEKLWVGLVGKEKEFDEEKTIKCFSILHYLKTSQKIVLRVLERRMLTLWWQMKPESVIQVMDCLLKNKIYATKILPVLGKWTNTNIHTLSEDNLLEIVSKLNSLEYTDVLIEKALERYIKVKGLNIKLDILMVAIMNHITMFKIRNPHILSGCAEYFIANGKNLNPIFLKPILYPFGFLNFQPSNGLKFWETVENVVSEKFLKIPVDDILDILLSCIYLEKYPLNFVTNVFNPNFLERINISEKSHKLRCKLKLLDTAMTLECKAYKGPLLPKYRTSQPYWYDGRIKRLVNHIRENLNFIAGGEDSWSTFVMLPNIFASNLYIVDLMIHPKGLRNSILSLNLIKDRNVNVAVLINLPDHFCSKGETLIGPQSMRIKHLRLMGVKVVSLKYEILYKLSIHSKALNNYIVENLKEALPAL